MSEHQSLDDAPRPSVVLFADTARRMRRFAVAIAAVFVTLVAARSVAAGSVSAPVIAETFGLVVLSALFGEVLIVGTAAIKGALRAKQAGQRLSRGDVTLTPPQFNRWLQRRFSVPDPQDQS